MNYLWKNPFFWGVIVTAVLLILRVVREMSWFVKMKIGEIVEGDMPIIEGWVKVIEVADGDTYRVMTDLGDEFLVRLIGADTPESVHPYRKPECYGLEATEFVEKNLLGEKVRLEYDASQGNEDKYGRLLRYVFLENGSNFNRLLIREGFANEYTYRKDYKYKASFMAGQLFAQTYKKGMWGDGACKIEEANSALVN